MVWVVKAEASVAEQQYADRPPEGYKLRDDQDPAREGDMAYFGFLGGEWRRVRRGQNVVGEGSSELWYSGVMAIARPMTDQERMSGKTAALGAG
jgi:hypothetical protein